MKCTFGLFLVTLLFVVPTNRVRAQSQPNVPEANEIKRLLETEPFSVETWPDWRNRLANWFGDTTGRTEQAYKEAERFLFRLADEKSGQLSEPLDRDHLAWYFLGLAYLDQPPLFVSDASHRAEEAFRQSILLMPTCARAHRHLALALYYQSPASRSLPNASDALLVEAERELGIASRLEPELPLHGIDGLVAKQRGDYVKALERFEKALTQEPHKAWLIAEIASCVVLGGKSEQKASTMKRLVERFPEDGVLASYYALSLILESRVSEARTELARARALGADPSRIISQQYVDRIEEGKTGRTEQVLKVLMLVAVIGGTIYLGFRLWNLFTAEKPTASSEPAATV